MPSIERLFAKLLIYLKDIVIDVVLKTEPSNKNLHFEDISKERYLEAISKARFNEGSAVYQGETELTWTEYFSFRRDQIEVSRKTLIDYAHYLDAECNSLLAELCEDQFLYVLIPNAVQCERSGIAYDMHIGEAGELLEMLYDLTEKLNDYYKKNLLPFHSKGNKQILGIYKGSHKQITL